MPILEVRAVAPTAPDAIPETLKKLCLAVAESVGIDPDGVWATWESIPPGGYVEGEKAATEQPPDTHPPLVRILVFETWEAGRLRRMMETTATALAEALTIEPGNVFVRVESMSSGTVYAGGKVLE